MIIHINLQNVFLYLYSSYKPVLCGKVIAVRRKNSVIFTITFVVSSARRLNCYAACLPSLRKCTTPVRSNANIRVGISTSCKIIPGIAFKKAPAMNICQVKASPATPVITMRTAPQIILPPSMAMISDRYSDTIHCQRE